MGECSAHGRRPVISCYVGRVNQEGYKGGYEIFTNAVHDDTIWPLLRLQPKRLSQDTVNKDLTENQPIPSWSGFNSILYLEMPRKSNIR